MIITSETIEILEKAEEIARLLLRSELGETYFRMHKNLQNDAEAQAKIAAFRKVKDQYEDVARFGKYHPDYSTLSKNMRALKREVDMQTSVVAFKRAETELERLLHEMSRLIADAVSPNIKVPSSNPFFNTSHKPGCGGGGSCQCSA